MLDKFFHKFLHIPYRLNMQRLHSSKQSRATVVFIHGIGNTLSAWDGVTKRLPDTIDVVTVDLLGFGESPKPDWERYSVQVQARAIARTLKSTKRAIVVGHSLGALVAVELARTAPKLVRRLVLCSPPLYENLLSREDSALQERLLRVLYAEAAKRPEQIERFAPVVVGLRLANKALMVTQDTINPYLGTLEASIVNQSALRDIKELKLPIKILYGAFDPVVVGSRIAKLGKEQKNVKTAKLFTGHEVIGLYEKAVAKEVMQQVVEVEKVDRRARRADA